MMTIHQRAILRRQGFERCTGRPYRELLSDLKNMHKPIDKFFFSRSWTWLQRTDSDITELVLLSMLDQNYTVLPIHDSFIVRRDGEGHVEETMKRAFERVVGVPCEVDKGKTLYDPAPEEPKPPIVRAADFVTPALDDIKRRSGYYRREHEWQQVWGPIG